MKGPLTAVITRQPIPRRMMWFGLLCVLSTGNFGCHRDMRDQPRYESLEASEFFSDGQSARPLIEGTVARGELNEDEALHTGKVAGLFVANIPFQVDRELLTRGQQRFEIYCTPCHDRIGTGHGMIVQRGFEQPPSYHTDRLRQAPAGHFFDVITNGFDTMPRFAPQITPHDRWAIVAYIRALQFSQNAKLSDVPSELREQLLSSEPGAKEQP
jgi:mono/diheme cytochrome c family protein